MISMNRLRERLISVMSQLKIAANNRPVKTRNNPPIGASSKFTAILFYFAVMAEKTAQSFASFLFGWLFLLILIISKHYVIKKHA